MDKRFKYYWINGKRELIYTPYIPLTIHKYPKKEKHNMISATTARELAQLPALIKTLDKKIRAAAEIGKSSVFISGDLNWEVHKKLRNEFGYEVSYDVTNNRTLIWWG
jgi:hypothetical protein